MFEDFDSLDMYGFLDYLEESSNIIEVDREELDRIISIEESYGIYEEDGQLFIENEMLDSVMDQYNLSEEDAIDAIIQACEEEINSLSERGRVKSKREAAWEARDNNGNVPQAQQKGKELESTVKGQNFYLNKLENDNKKEVERAKNFNSEWRQEVNNMNMSANNYNKDKGRIDNKTEKAQGHLVKANNDLQTQYNRNDNINKTHSTNLANQATGHKKEQSKNIRNYGAGGAVAGAAVAAGAGYLAHRAYKKHKENKRKNRGLRGMVRRGIKRFREDYGIYEQDGQLFIENEVLDYVMDEFNLLEEDALDILMEAYEEELLGEGRNGHNYSSNQRFNTGYQRSYGNQGGGHKQRYIRSNYKQTVKAKEQPKPVDRDGLEGVKQKAAEDNFRKQVNFVKTNQANPDKRPKPLTAKQIGKKIDEINDEKAKQMEPVKAERKQLRKDERTAQKVLDTSRDKYNFSKTEKDSLTDEIKNVRKKVKSMTQYNDNLENKNKQELATRQSAHDEKQKGVKRNSLIGGAAVGAGAVGVGMLAHKAYKKHQENKRKNRGLRGMVRRGIKRLREDYGIYEENGQLFVENEVLDYVMDEFNLYEEDALAIIMEAYEEEFFDWEE